TGTPEPEVGYCAHKIELDPEDPDTLYMQDHGAVNKSTNGGDSWYRIEEGLGKEGDERFGFPIAISPTGDLYLVPLKSSEERVMHISVTVPSLLRDCTGDQRDFTLEAGTVAEALREMLGRYPLLRFHLYDDAEKLRPHLLIYYNDQNIAWLESLDVPLSAGD